MWLLPLPPDLPAERGVSRSHRHAGRSRRCHLRLLTHAHRVRSLRDLGGALRSTHPTVRPKLTGAYGSTREQRGSSSQRLPIRLRRFGMARPRVRLAQPGSAQQRSGAARWGAALGLAVAATLAPLLWLAGFVRQGASHTGATGGAPGAGPRSSGLVAICSSSCAARTRSACRSRCSSSRWPSSSS